MVGGKGPAAGRGQRRGWGGEGLHALFCHEVVDDHLHDAHHVQLVGCAHLLGQRIGLGVAQHHVQPPVALAAHKLNLHFKKLQARVEHAHSALERKVRGLEAAAAELKGLRAARELFLRRVLAQPPACCHQRLQEHLIHWRNGGEEVVHRHPGLLCLLCSGHGAQVSTSGHYRCISDVKYHFVSARQCAEKLCCGWVRSCTSDQGRPSSTRAFVLLTHPRVHTPTLSASARPSPANGPSRR